MEIKICNKCKIHICTGYHIQVNKFYSDNSISYLRDNIDLCPECYENFERYLEAKDET